MTHYQIYPFQKMFQVIISSIILPAIAFSGDYGQRSAPHGALDQTDTREWRLRMNKDVYSLETTIWLIGATIFVFTLIAIIVVAFCGWCSIRRRRYQVRSNLDVIQHDEGLNLNSRETYL